MSANANRRDFIVKTAAVLSAGSSVVACGVRDDGDNVPSGTLQPSVAAAQFRYGVAKGGTQSKYQQNPVKRASPGEQHQALFQIEQGVHPLAGPVVPAHDVFIGSG